MTTKLLQKFYAKNQMQPQFNNLMTVPAQASK